MAQEQTVTTSSLIRREYSDASHRLAITAFALGLLTYASLFFLGVVQHRPTPQQIYSKLSLSHWAFALMGVVPYASSIGAVITGRLAVSRIDRSRDPAGARLAKYGFFLGTLGLTLLVILPLLGFAFFVLLSSGGTPH